MIGSTEIIILVVVIGVLIFGAKRFQNLQKHLVKPKENLRRGRSRQIKNSKTSRAKLTMSVRTKK